MQTFELTDEHIKLLRSAAWRWEDCEFGAPAIDCKRPYGNTSVYEDMAAILGIDRGAVDKTYLRQLHEELEVALQVIFQFGSFTPGRFTREKSWGDWSKG